MTRIDEGQMMLARDYAGQNVIGWHCSEKLDGCRAYWDGSRFWTRGGCIVDAPGWFTAGLPRVHLDGELWAGLGGLREAQAATQHGKFSERIKFAVFDAPHAPGTWAERMRFAEQQLQGVGATFAFPVPFTRIESKPQLRRTLGAILDEGGEGIVFRSAGALGYCPGRADTFLRLKSLAAL